MALLAQTCSQIGADNGTLKPILLEKSGKKTENRSPSASNNNNNNNSNMNNNNSSNSSANSSNNHNNKNEKSSPEIRLAFKPYEMNVLSTRKVDDRPSSKSSNDVNSESETNSVSKDKRVPSRNTSPSNGSNNNNNNNREENGEKVSPVPAKSPEDKGASPIIRSGMEVLHGSPKESYKSGYGMPGFYSTGIDPASNPAFRSPYGLSHHAAMLAAASGYQTGQTPFMSYARIKTPSGGEALVPVCKDPYCTGCQFSAHNQQMLMGTPCPQGCTTCEHQKYMSAGMAAMAGTGLPPGHPYSQLAAANRAGYVCSWPVAGTYCGKRFETSEELFAHVRTHSPALADPAAVLAAQQNPLLNPLSSLFSQSPLSRLYPGAAQLSPLSAATAARYHPYAKPGSLQLPSAISNGSPYPTFNPALAQYYSPYAALYGQRIGAAHP